MSVPARITVATIGARDIESLTAFYEQLGWRAAVKVDDFAAFETDGIVFTLYALDSLARDSGLTAGARDGAIRSNLAINVGEREQVDETLEAARVAGARVITEPRDMEFGPRSAYFADPEDNYWEIAWVPPDSKMAELLKRAASGGGP